ncbi:hypothetical protein A5892_11315 [Halotalea alkalilenta]|uniref:Negative regulator for alginate biosynthesis MucB n=1 Tax=Halotalea alkalilenta TaxID=376489 RepID=A0A172YG83_9GAMM|nr:hypothetical protein A5892_11315 [Halotalea alkalilenta]
MMAGRISGARCGALVAGTFLFLLLSFSFQARGDVQVRSPSGQVFLDCSSLKDAYVDRHSGQEAFARTLLAVRCFNYRMLVVRASAAGMKAFELEHGVGEEGERAAIKALDGEMQPGLRRLEGGLPSILQLAAPDVSAAALAEHYRFELIGRARIADRPVIVIDAVPMDELRYAQRFWLDSHSGLPLKRLTIDLAGRVVETLQVVRLEQLEAFDGRLAVNSAMPVDGGTGVSWLPEGFVARGQAAVELAGERMESRLYGDGLSSLSVFVGPWLDAAALPAGLHALGASKAMVRHLGVKGSGYQVVVVGEVPDPVLVQVAEGVAPADDGHSTQGGRSNFRRE